MYLSKVITITTMSKLFSINKSSIDKISLKSETNGTYQKVYINYKDQGMLFRLKDLKSPFGIQQFKDTENHSLSVSINEELESFLNSLKKKICEEVVDKELVKGVDSLEKADVLMNDFYTTNEKYPSLMKLKVHYTKTGIRTPESFCCKMTLNDENICKDVKECKIRSKMCSMDILIKPSFYKIGTKFGVSFGIYQIKFKSEKQRVNLLEIESEDESD